jgi:phosphoribosylglycinamide formyltransferase-1
VHEAVKAAGEKETGITIHEVNERYDEGKILFQTKCEVNPHDTPEQIAQKVHQLEYKHYPRVIEEWVLKST